MLFGLLRPKKHSNIKLYTDKWKKVLSKKKSRDVIKKLFNCHYKPNMKTGFIK